MLTIIVKYVCNGKEVGSTVNNNDGFIAIPRKSETVNVGTKNFIVNNVNYNLINTGTIVTVFMNKMI